MTLLKFKSIIYRYTGIYLANQETLDYIDSKEYYKQMLKIIKNEDMALRDIHGLLIGMWQADHGFCRPMSFLQYRRPSLIFKPIAFIVDFYTVLKWDIKWIFKMLLKRLK